MIEYIRPAQCGGDLRTVSDRERSSTKQNSPCAIEHRTFFYAQLLMINIYFSESKKERPSHSCWSLSFFFEGGKTIKRLFRTRTRVFNSFLMNPFHERSLAGVMLFVI